MFGVIELGFWQDIRSLNALGADVVFGGGEIVNQLKLPEKQQ
jgi:hypothetical protein